MRMNEFTCTLSLRRIKKNNYVKMDFDVLDIYI